jgi:hypothetical protein
MKHWIYLVVFAFITPVIAAETPDILEESLYHNFRQHIKTEIKSKSAVGFVPFEQSLFVDALWDMLDENSREAQKVLGQIEPFHYDLVQRLRVEILKLKYDKAIHLSPELVAELENTLRAPEVETKLIYTLAAYEEDLLAAGHIDLVSLAKNHFQYFDIEQDQEKKKELSKNVIADLFYDSPDVTTYMNGEYVNSVKVFMFCRTNRLYPCLMVMRDIHGRAVRNDDGSLWTHKSLASSARGLPSYTRNGNTPAGVWTIDSVMPYADQQISFGKFRRMIINFIPKSQDERLIKSLIPQSSHTEGWWHQTLTARDIGRNLFRIHGTGKKNMDPTTPYYPFMRTSGCIAQRENTYEGTTYKDQRVLLDTIMSAMDLIPEFSNEVKVKGILYVMEVDDQNRAVETQDLFQWGIE